MHYNFKNIHYFNNHKDELSRLFEKYGSDKGYIDIKEDKPYNWKPHSYGAFYYNLFNHCKNEIKLIFEFHSIKFKCCRVLFYLRFFEQKIALQLAVCISAPNVSDSSEAE